MSPHSASRRAIAFLCVLIPGAFASCRVAGSRSTANGCSAMTIGSINAGHTLGQPVTAAHAIPGDSESCEFASGSRHLQVSIRPHHGRLDRGELVVRPNAPASDRDPRCW